MVGAAVTMMTTVGAVRRDNNRRRFVTRGIRDDGEAKTTDDVVTNNRSEDDDPREGDRHATGVVDALNWLTRTVYIGIGLDGDRSSSLAQEADVSQFSVRYEYVLWARPTKVRR